MATIKHSAQRVAVLIDTANLYHSAKNIYKARVNFGAVLKEAVGNRQLIRAIAYVITTEGGEEKAFFDALTKVGIETRTKDLQVFNDGAKKADWDVGITVDAIALAPKSDTIILVTGDGDFVPLVEYIQNAWGCQVEVVAFGRATSAALKAATDSFTDLCEEPRNFLIGYRGGSSRGGTRKASSKKTSAPDVDHTSHTLAAEEIG